ncbi:MAG: hypothetical protein ACT6FD_02745 [Methanosarcinaceae archaeon]
MAAESRTEELRTVIKQVRDGEFGYNSREPPITNWNLYDNAQIKCRFGAPLRKRLDAYRVTETQLKNVAHNVRRIGYLEIMDDIVPHWQQG